MKYKKTLIFIFFGISIFIGIKYIKNNNQISIPQEYSPIKNQQDIIVIENKSISNEIEQSKNDERDTLFEDEDKYEYKTTEKLKYNEFTFKKFLEKSASEKVPGNKNCYFASKVLAIDKKNLKNPNYEILWEDRYLYYISSKNTGIKASPTNFNTNYSLVTFDKSNSRIGIVNGFIILRTKKEISSMNHFSNKYNVNIVSSYPSDNVYVVRTKRKTNIIQTISKIKGSSSIKSANLEIINTFSLPQ
ncbi:hypothetical protein [Fluviispira multicolorata]|uniref:Uncharacterized protein n=1 Tax=Fluviispira multicolorata TaxID=2654512 RepID=A0A833JAE5_9BACT|nr:hypothetical protein [Fluviispira multicolorata]KAB8027769.1 hypothetical protein GCL57_14275 [Fluviispira multicolorata]